MPLSSVRLLCAALLVCLPVGCGKAPPAAEESSPASVKVAKAKPEMLGEWTELLGTTQPLPARFARVTAVVEGRVLSVLGDGKGKAVVEGQRVEAGQPIVRLDDHLARANRDKLADTVTELEELKKQARFAVDLADIEVKRLTELTGTGGGSLPAVSRVELEKARVARKDAEAKMQVAEARLEAGRSEVKAADAHLEYYTLRAPIPGQLGLIQVVPGQTLAVGTTVTDVVDLDQIDVLCFVPPYTARRLVLDKPARLPLTLPSPPGGEGRVRGADKATGKVVFLADQANPDTGSFAVKVRFPNGETHLRANTVQHVRVLTEPEKERLLIDEAAVQEDQEPPVVFIVLDAKGKDKEGNDKLVRKAHKRQVTLGVRDREGNRVEIIELKGEEKDEKISPRDALFVVAGANGLHDDDELKVEEKAAEDEHK